MNDPLRLIDAGNAAFAEIESGLREARAQRPSVEQRARMRAALGLTAASLLPSGPVPARGIRASGARPTMWLELVLGAAILFGAVWYAPQLWRSLRESQAPNAQSAPPRPSASAAPAPRPSQAPAAQPPPPASAPAAPSPAVHGRAEGQRSTHRDVPRATPLSGESAGDPTAELALLKEAKAHARSAPSRALALLAEHERRFAKGAFAQEREVIAVEALIVARDRSAAELRAQRFFDRYPESAHARRVRTLLAGADAADPSHRRPP